MAGWRRLLRVDPLPALQASGDGALGFFTHRDLLGQDAGSVSRLSSSPQAQKILRQQREDGAWQYPSRRKHGLPNENYDLLETYRSLRILIDKYGFDHGHSAIRTAAEYLLAHQTEEGDIRGIFGTEYVPHYTAWMLELLIKAGYAEDLRIKRGLEWFLLMRQEDGGWAWPIRSASIDYYEAQKDPEPTLPDRSKPFSHVLTGGILRAFAVHPEYGERNEVHTAALLLKSRFFKPDKYPDRRAVHYWTKFQYPFWWPNILTALDSLARIGYDREDTDVQKALRWFVNHQQPDGLWSTSYKISTPDKDLQARLWVALAICRVFQQFWT